jgi:selenide,water dikinase
LSDVLRLLPKSAHPDLLVGFDTSDDAGVFRVSDHQALVQTVDFFTPIVDDPYSYGAIAAANSLSDIYAMGGRPITAMNICCFDPTLAPAEDWANIFRGMFDKTVESGAVLVGGHSVEDKEPKFGLSVTGLVDPEKMFANIFAEPGDFIVLSKPLGTGIVTTAHKFDLSEPQEIDAAIRSMTTLNRAASEWGTENGVRCATDITGFGLAGHLFNIAKGSGVSIEIQADSLPLLAGLDRMVEAGCITAGASRNREHIGGALVLSPSVDRTHVEAFLDPQTSGGLAMFVKQADSTYPVIGRVLAKGKPSISLI